MNSAALCIALVASLTGTAQAALVEFERDAVGTAPIAGLTSRAALAATAGSAVTEPGDASELRAPVRSGSYLTRPSARSACWTAGRAPTRAWNACNAGHGARSMPVKPVQFSTVNR